MYYIIPRVSVNIKIKRHTLKYIDERKQTTEHVLLEISRKDAKLIKNLGCEKNENRKRETREKTSSMNCKVKLN